MTKSTILSLQQASLVKNVARLVIFIAIAVSALVVLLRFGEATPATKAYLAVDLTTMAAFAFGYYISKDKFWLIMLASTLPMFVSDLYFFPSFSFLFPRTNAQGIGGVGMNMWAGIHLIVISIGCIFYFRKTIFTYLNIIALVATVVTNLSLGTGLLSRNAIGQVVATFFQTIVVGYLVYYGIKTNKKIFIAGAIVWLGSLFAIGAYFFAVSNDIAPFTLRISDKTLTVARALTGIGALENLNRFKLDKK